MKLSLIVMVSGAMVFAAGSSHAAWLAVSGQDHATVVQPVKDNKNARDKHEKKQAKKQKQREKEDAAAQREKEDTAAAKTPPPGASGIQPVPEPKKGETLLLPYKEIDLNEKRSTLDTLSD